MFMFCNWKSTKWQLNISLIYLTHYQKDQCEPVIAFGIFQTQNSKRSPVSYMYWYCIFTAEIQEFCGWTQDKTDDFDWSINKGSTKSSETGPTIDHTLKTGKMETRYEWVSDCCLTPTQQFLSYIMARTS